MRRQRPDGTWTYASEEWDRKWYWPIGTRAEFRGQAGTVIKRNAVSVWLRLDSGPTIRVSVTALTRM
jgi:hypothetical protein